MSSLSYIYVYIYIYIYVYIYIVNGFGIAVKSSVEHSKSLSLISHGNTINTYLLQ